MSIETSLSSDERVFSFTLSGDFDINQSLKMQDIIDSVPPTVKHIRIDMQHIAQIETSIFSTLLLLYREKDTSIGIELFNCSKALVQRLTLAGLNRLITLRMSNELSAQNSQADVLDLRQPSKK